MSPLVIGLWMVLAVQEPGASNAPAENPTATAPAENPTATAPAENPTETSPPTDVSAEGAAKQGDGARGESREDDQAKPSEPGGKLEDLPDALPNAGGRHPCKPCPHVPAHDCRKPCPKCPPCLPRIVIPRAMTFSSPKGVRPINFDVGTFLDAFPDASPHPLGKRLVDVADHNTEYYGWEEERIRCFAVTYRETDEAGFDTAGALQAAADVYRGQLSTTAGGQVKFLGLPAGRIFRTRLASDRYIVLCCVNDSRTKDEVPDLFLVAVKEDAQGRFIPFGLKREGTQGDIEIGVCEYDLDAVCARVKTGGYMVEISVERMSNGDVGFRFLRPR